MKSLLSFVGWVLFLAAAVVGLVFYNAVHVPALRRLARQQTEVRMWTTEVESLKARVDRVRVVPETTFVAVFSFDELFGSAEGFSVSAGGESALRDIVTMLRQSAGPVTVIGHTDDGELPSRVKGLYPSRWHYAAAAASSVAQGLAGWGIPANRLTVRSEGAGRPRDSNATLEGRSRNRRVEILVLREKADG
ncbi:MAG TPA: hypothetical protein ENN51_01430 [candidate division WOR-3 bacterium]|uniref:OmpA-like domain-containing protein n=1 Tax=candidate division WOR-3 bacterium TaxID=2052148 RepID=A0A7V0T4V0_UNCW3|nr:hypothetical protein [candidate division WOR-3 bacterium]